MNYETLDYIVSANIANGKQPDIDHEYEVFMSVMETFLISILFEFYLKSFVVGNRIVTL